MHDENYPPPFALQIRGIQVLLSVNKKSRYLFWKLRVDYVRLAKALMDKKIDLFLTDAEGQREEIMHL